MAGGDETMGDALAKAGPQEGLSRPSNLSEAFRLAGHLKNASGFLPKGLQTEGQILAVILKAAELGIGTMTALQGMHVVQGKVGMSYDMMIALLRRGGYRVEWLEHTAERATLRLTAPDSTQHVETWDVERAKRAGLWGNQGPWKNYPETMLMARCVSSAGRAFAGDVLTGIYSEEEVEEIAASSRPVPANDPAPAIEAEPEVDPAAATEVLVATFEAAGNPQAISDGNAMIHHYVRRMHVVFTPEQKAAIQAAREGAEASIAQRRADSDPGESALGDTYGTEGDDA